MYIGVCLKILIISLTTSLGSNHCICGMFIHPKNGNCDTMGISSINKLMTIPGWGHLYPSFDHGTYHVGYYMPLYHIAFPLYIGSTQYLTVEQSSMLWAYNGTCIQYPYYPLVNSHNYVKSPPATGKSTINGPCSTAMLVCRRISMKLDFHFYPRQCYSFSPELHTLGWSERRAPRQVYSRKASVTGFGNQTWLAGKSSQLHKCGS